MPDPDNSVATAAQPASPAEAAARADTAPPQPPPNISMDQGGLPPAMPVPSATRAPVQYGSVPEATPDRLSPRDAQLQHDSFGTKVYHGVMSALGGTQETTITGYDPKTGAPIISSTPSGPGMQWKKIISGALTGLAASSQVKGPGSPMRGFGAGYQAVQEQAAQQRQEQRATAQQTFQNQQQAAKNSAEVSMMTTQTAGLSFNLTREKVKASVEDTDRMSKFNELISSGGEGTRYLQHFDSMDAVTKAFRDDPSLHDSHAQGQIVAIPHVNADGQIEGVDAAFVTKGWQDQKIDHDVTFTTQRFANGKLEDVPFTIKAGSYSNGDVMKLMMGQAQDSLNNHWKQVQTESEANLRAKQGTEALASAAEKRAGAAKTDAEVSFLNEHGEFPGSGGKGTIDPEDMPSVVKAVGEGRVSMGTLSRMLSKNPTLADEITKTYPDFREGMVKTFDKQQTQFTSGPIGGSLNSAGTSVAHLIKLQSFNTPASHIPGTPDYRRYQEQARIASEELSKFYGGGKATVSGTADHMKDLGGVGPGRDKAIVTAIGDLGDKMQEYHQQWQNAMPSQYWTMPMPGITASDEALLARVDPQYAAAMKNWAPRGAPTPTPAPGAAPGGATPRGVSVTAPTPAPGSKPAPTLSQVPAGARPGYDTKTGALLGYQAADGWHAF